MCYMGGYDKKHSAQEQSVWHVTECVIPFHSIFLFQVSKEDQSQYFPRTQTLVYVKVLH